MHGAPRGFLLPLTLLAWASACATGSAPRRDPAPLPAPVARCGFLLGPSSRAPAADEGCDPKTFLDDEVELLVRGLEADPGWGALVSPELEAEGRTVVVANVVPSLDYFRRESAGEVADEVQRLVRRVQIGIVNRLFRRSLTLERADGTHVTVDFQEGQLRGQSFNDYQEYLTQIGQRDGAADFFPTYQAVDVEGRAARTGLLWLLSGHKESDGSVKVEFRIKTFEMERSPDAQALTIRGQLADRTGQLLGAVYTTWVNGRVRAYDPNTREDWIAAGPRPGDSELGSEDLHPRGVREEEPEAREAAPAVAVEPEAESPPPLEEAPTDTFADHETRVPEARPPGYGEPSRAIDPVLWVTIARVRGEGSEPRTLSFGRGPLPRNGDRFALVFLNEQPELVAYMFGPTLPGALAVRVASDDTDRSAVAPARRGQDVAVAMSSVYAHATSGPKYALILRREQPWSLEEQGRAQWACRPESTYRLGDLPATRHGGEVRVSGWVKNELEKLLGDSIARAPAAVEAKHFLTLPLERIPPGGEENDALCVILPFSPPQPEGDV